MPKIVARLYIQGLTKNYDKNSVHKGREGEAEKGGIKNTKEEKVVGGQCQEQKIVQNSSIYFVKMQKCPKDSYLALKLEKKSFKRYAPLKFPCHASG